MDWFEYQHLRMEIRIKLLFFSGKRPSVSVENEKSEYAEIAPQAKEWLLTKSTSMRLQCWKERLLCFSGWGGEEEKRHLLGGQLCETETSKHRNMSEVLRRNPSNKTSGICRTFVFRTSTPARAAVTSENKHSICDIFSEYFLLKVLHNLYIIPKLFIKLCWVACYIADSFNKSQMWQIIHRCLNACF